MFVVRDWFMRGIASLRCCDHVDGTGYLSSDYILKCSALLKRPDLDFTVVTGADNDFFIVSLLVLISS
jgi:hypothetical protein